VAHTATSYDDIFNSGNLSQGKTFSYTFNELGTYDYFCIPHPWMMGQIIVEE
jgi:plastocyanin